MELVAVYPGLRVPPLPPASESAPPSPASVPPTPPCPPELPAPPLAAAPPSPSPTSVAWLHPAATTSATTASPRMLLIAPLLPRQDTAPRPVPANRRPAPGGTGLHKGSRLIPRLTRAACPAAVIAVGPLARPALALFRRSGDPGMAGNLSVIKRFLPKSPGRVTTPLEVYIIYLLRRNGIGCSIPGHYIFVGFSRVPLTVNI
jgi:hypothetical protein